MKWKWGIAFIPLGLGLIVAALLGSGRLANPVLRLRAELGTLSVVVGLALSAVVATLSAL